MEQCGSYTGWLETVADLIKAYLYCSGTVRQVHRVNGDSGGFDNSVFYCSGTVRQVYRVTGDSGGFDNSISLL